VFNFLPKNKVIIVSPTFSFAADIEEFIDQNWQGLGFHIKGSIFKVVVYLIHVGIILRKELFE